MDPLPLPPTKGLPFKINTYDDVDEPRYKHISSPRWLGNAMHGRNFKIDLNLLNLIENGKFDQNCEFSPEL